MCPIYRVYRMGCVSGPVNITITYELPLAFAI